MHNLSRLMFPLSKNIFLSSTEPWGFPLCNLLLNYPLSYRKQQNQPSRGVLLNRCSENYNKLTGEHPYRSAISIELLCNFIKISLRCRCSPENLLHIQNSAASELLFLRTPLEGWFWINTRKYNLIDIKVLCDVYLLHTFDNLVFVTSIQYVIYSYMYNSNIWTVF